MAVSIWSGRVGMVANMRQDKRKLYRIWLGLEGKRMATRLPMMFIEAVILVCLVALLIFLGGRVLQKEQSIPNVTVAVVVSPEDSTAQLAMAFVEGMEAVKGWCHFVITDRMHGMAMLERGEAIALIELPEGMAESILDGRNIPATLYLPEKLPGAAYLLQELASVGVSLLSTVQNEIYAVDRLYVGMDADVQLEEVYEVINGYHISIVQDRERLFYEKKLSVVEGMTPTAYYAGSLLALYVLLLSMSLGDYPAGSMWRDRIWKSYGLSWGMQTMGRIWWIACALTLGCMPFMVFIGFWGARGGVNQHWSIATILGVAAAFLCTAALVHLLHLIFDVRRNLLLALGTGSLALGYFCGCYLPEVLLPESIKRVAVYLPLTYMRRAWTDVFTNKEGDWKNTGILLMFAIFFYVLCYIRLKSMEDTI